MNLIPQSRTKRNIAVFFAIHVALQFVFTANSPAQDAAAKESDKQELTASNVDFERLDALLQRLDSTSFKDREAATTQLVEMGPSILKPLTVHFFQSSSEAGWRIHRILEEIGRNGNEDDFLKAIAIIQLLFGSQDEKSQQRLAELQYQWKATRRKEAARKLKRLGFEFYAPTTGSVSDRVMERVGIERMVRAAAVRELGGIEIATSATPIENMDKKKEVVTRKWVDPRTDRQESIRKIEQIIGNSEDENRKFLGDHLPKSLQVNLPPGTLTFPPNWQADEESLELIEDLSLLSYLSLREQNIDANLQQFIASQTFLFGLSLTDCEFEESDELSIPPTVNTLVLDGSTPPPKFFSTLRQIATLKLKKITFDDELAGAVRRCKVQMIDLEEVNFSRSSIRKLLTMRGLVRVKLSLCPFDLEWFEDIRKRNFNLVQAAPKAFLGVQGPIEDRGRETSGCQISHVVPDTAAAKGGMQSMDIVTSMDGNKISSFEDLRLLISQKRPGETMDLKVQRDGKPVELKVELGQLNTPLR